MTKQQPLEDKEKNKNAAAGPENRNFQFSNLSNQSDEQYFDLIQKMNNNLIDTQRDLIRAKYQAECANKAKDDFLSCMSHDLRTPLNAIIGFSNLAMHEENSEKKQNYIEKIHSSAILLQDLVSDTLEYSRIESGKLELNPEEVNERDFLDSLVTALQPMAELKKIQLITESLMSPNDVIIADRLKLQRIVMNLLSNAIKYTPEGGTVSLKIQPLDPPENGFTRRVIVEDNGIGMSPQFLDRLYQPYAQELRPEAGNVASTGLGLMIVKKYTDLMKGSIKVKSEFNKGTRFTIDFPFQWKESASHENETASTEKISFSGKRVLLCEDNPLNTEIAVAMMSEKGLEAECAVNGQEGLKKFADSQPGYFDLILMDVRMPVMNGYEATQCIRRLDRPDAKSIPIIAMTADTFAEDIQKCLNAGMNGHIAKPIDPAKMYSTIYNFMKSKQETAGDGCHR